MGRFDGLESHAAVGSCQHSAVRVRRNFAFLDLSGFTTLTASEGDERAVAVVSVFRSRLREICSRRAVRIGKWLGDGAMLVSVETPPLLAATLEMQWLGSTSLAPVAVHGGVTTGDVILLEGDDYIGHSVNLAARLCERAAVHEVLADEAVLAHLPPWGAVLSADEVTVRGIDAPVSVARLGLRPPTEGAVADPVCGIPLTPATAVEIRFEPLDARDDGLGQSDGAAVLFCSESCLDTWQSRPAGTDALPAPAAT